MGTCPSLWTAFPLLLSPSNVAYTADILGLPRMALLKRVRVQGCRLTIKHLKAILESKVEAVTIGDGNDMEKDVDISSLPPTSLAKLASELKELNLHNSLMHQLSKQQMLALATKLEQPSSKLESLEILFDNHLMCLPPSCLARALANLTHLTLVRIIRTSTKLFTLPTYDNRCPKSWLQRNMTGCLRR